MAGIVFRSLATIVIGYLLGSIPFGLIVGRAAGVDVRQMGSGKTGATNVLRSAGVGPGLLVAACDLLKGAVPVLLAKFVLASPAAFGSHSGLAPWIASAAGLAAIAGHNFPVFADFRGGRGVATTSGMALALAPIPTLLTAPFFLIPIILTRYVSLGSVLGSIALVLIDLIMVIIGASLGGGYATFIALAIAAIAIIASHRDNMQRIASGTERKIGEKALPVQARPASK
jgi:glycerol-3-phosphate acyltransferase PlsY